MQWLNGLLSKHRAWVFIPSTYAKSWVWRFAPVTPSLESRDRRTPDVTGQPNQSGELEAQREALSQKVRWAVTEAET